MSNKKLLLFFSITQISNMMYAPSMTLSQIRNIRDGVFDQALDAAKAAGGESNLLIQSISNADQAISTPGIESYPNYHEELYEPYVKVFGADPEKMHSLIGDLSTIQNTIKQALPSQGGVATLANQQSALKAVQSFLGKGGSPFVFLNDVNAIINSLTPAGAAGAGAGSGGATTDTNVLNTANTLQPLYTTALQTNNTVNLTALAQCSTDLKTFLSPLLQNTIPTTIPANFTAWAQNLVTKLQATGGGQTMSDDKTLITIGKIFLQNLDTYFDNNENPTAIVNMDEFIKKINSINKNPQTIISGFSVDDMLALTELTPFEAIDSLTQKYNGGSNGEYSYYNSGTLDAWLQTVTAGLIDIVLTQDALIDYANTENAVIDFDPVSDFVVDKVQELITTFQELLTQNTNDNKNTAPDQSKNVSDLTTDPNIIEVAKALSGINRLPDGSMETYIIQGTDKTTIKVDPAKLTNMAKFATTLRNALNLWQGDLSDPSTAADPSLCFTSTDFASYAAAMNGAVADETDILENLQDTYDADGIFHRGLFKQIGDKFNVDMEYDIGMLPSANIVGNDDLFPDTDSINPKGVYAAMSIVNDLTPPAVYNLGESVASLAQALANQIENHNNMINAVINSATIIKKAFTDVANNTTSIGFSNGNYYSVTGTTGPGTQGNPASASSRAAVEETFYQLAGGQNGLITYLKQQADLLIQQANAIISSGASSENFKTTNGTIIKAVNSFENADISIGTNNPGTCNVTLKVKNLNIA